jgi:MFS superfamily sulfate permease-like transporter
VATLAPLVGIFLATASVLRLGFLASFISEPVLAGFKAGIGVVIIVDQLPKLIGVHFPKSTFLHHLLAMLQNLPHTSLATPAVGIAMIALSAGSSTTCRKSRRGGRRHCRHGLSGAAGPWRGNRRHNPQGLARIDAIGSSLLRNTAAG